MCTSCPAVKLMGTKLHLHVLHVTAAAGAAKRRAEEEAAKAAQRHVPRDYRTGKMTGVVVT